MEELAYILKRGLRSGIGIQSFKKGGFNIDVGKLKIQKNASKFDEFKMAEGLENSSCFRFECRWSSWEKGSSRFNQPKVDKPLTSDLSANLY